MSLNVNDEKLASGVPYSKYVEAWKPAWQGFCNETVSKMTQKVKEDGTIEIGQIMQQMFVDYNGRAVPDANQRLRLFNVLTFDRGHG